MITIDRDTARTGTLVAGRPGSARGFDGACLPCGGLR
jgi:hypothetical protein